jgi:hypothetical protein
MAVIVAEQQLRALNPGEQDNAVKTAKTAVVCADGETIVLDHGEAVH